MTTMSVARYLLLLGLPLLSVCYIPLNLRPSESLHNPPPKLAASPVALPPGSGFATIRKLARKQEYVAVIEQLQHIPKTNPHYENVQQIKGQYQQKAVAALGACSHGFDPEALKRSSFYKASNDQYIAQVECYPSGRSTNF